MADHGETERDEGPKESGSNPETERSLGVWRGYGPLSDAALFLRPDPELEAIVEATIWPDAAPEP